MAKQVQNYGVQNLVVTGFDQNSIVASHVHHFNHNINFENGKVVGFEAYYHERPFLYSWSDRWKRSYRTSRSLQRQRASMHYMLARASFALC